MRSRKVPKKWHLGTAGGDVQHRWCHRLLGTVTLTTGPRFNHVGPDSPLGIGVLGFLGGPWGTQSARRLSGGAAPESGPAAPQRGPCRASYSPFLAAHWPRADSCLPPEQPSRRPSRRRFGAVGWRPWTVSTQGALTTTSRRPGEAACAWTRKRTRRRARNIPSGTPPASGIAAVLFSGRLARGPVDAASLETTRLGGVCSGCLGAPSVSPLTSSHGLLGSYFQTRRRRQYGIPEGDRNSHPSY